MTRKLRVLLVAMIISCGGVVAYLAPTAASAGPTLQVVRGSGEFQTFEIDRDDLGFTKALLVRDPERHVGATREMMY